MNAYTAVAIINTAIVVMVGAVSFSGFFFADSPDGLWSMLALLCMVSAPTGEGK